MTHSMTVVPPIENANAGRLLVVTVAASRADGKSTAAVGLARDWIATLGATVESIALRELPLAYPDQDPSFLPLRVLEAQRFLELADLIIIGAPVVRASVSGLARHWIEVFRHGLAGKAIVPIVAAGSCRSHLAAEALRADLILNFRARPTAAIVVTPDLTDEELRSRLEVVLAGAFAEASGWGAS